MAADAVLHSGIPREVLLAAFDLAHPGAESAAESRGRVTMLRIGVEVPELQQPFVLDDGSLVSAGLASSPPAPPRRPTGTWGTSTRR